MIFERIIKWFGAFARKTPPKQQNRAASSETPL
jgi:hypothetical protein